MSDSTKEKSVPPEIETGLQAMASNSTIRSIKIICRLATLIAVRFWKLCTSATLIILLLYWFYGGAFTLIFLMAAVFGIFYYSQDMFLYYPNQPANSRIFVELPTKLRLPYENVTIKTSDGVNINAVLIKHTKQGVPTVMLLHGNAGNIGHRLAIAYYIVSVCGSNVLLLEYRGYGKSSGSPSESGLYLDAEAGLVFLLQRSDLDTSKLFIYGSSLGGAVAINLCSIPKYSNAVAGLVLENTFTSLPGVASSLFSTKAIDFLPYFCYKNKYPSEYRIGKVSMPTLFLSGQSDDLIPPQMMSQLYNLSGSKFKSMKTFPNGTHNETWMCPGFFEEFSHFIKQVLEKQMKRKASNSQIEIGDTKIV